MLLRKLTYLFYIDKAVLSISKCSSSTGTRSIVGLLIFLSSFVQPVLKCKKVVSTIKLVTDLYSARIMENGVRLILLIIKIFLFKVLDSFWCTRTTSQSLLTALLCATSETRSSHEHYLKYLQLWVFRSCCTQIMGQSLIIWRQGEKQRRTKNWILTVLLKSLSSFGQIA